MTEIDELVRRNGALLRDKVAHSVDLEASLVDLQARRRRQRRTRVVAALAVSAAAVAVVAAVGATRDPGTTEPSPAPPGPTPRPSQPFVCEEEPSVHCLSGGRVRVDFPHPFTLTPPDGFDSDVDVTDKGASLYRTDTEKPAAVTFIDDVVVPRSGGQHLSARQLADWVAARPYLTARPGSDSIAPSRTTIDGRPAWEVQVIAYRAPRGRTGGCNMGTQPTCWPLLGTPREPTAPWETGPWQGMATRYTFVDLPGGATFVIWSGAFGDWAAIDSNQDLISTFHFALH